MKEKKSTYKNPTKKQQIFINELKYAEFPLKIIWICFYVARKDNANVIAKLNERLSSF